MGRTRTGSTTSLQDYFWFHQYAVMADVAVIEVKSLGVEALICGFDAGSLAPAPTPTSSTAASTGATRPPSAVTPTGAIIQSRFGPLPLYI
jgi:hypothetical protein